MLDDCKLWEGSTTKDGYGRLTHNSKTVLAHRLSYCEHNNLKLEDITGLEVRHKCDVRACVNPCHLELGSHADNMNDMKVRGRAPRGERNGSVKLSETEVLEILTKIADGCKQTDVAKEYKVSKTAVADLVSGEAWAHVGESERARVKPGRVAERNGRAKITEDAVRRIRELYSVGNSQVKLAEMFGITQVAVSKIIRRVTWANVD